MRNDVDHTAKDILAEFDMAIEDMVDSDVDDMLPIQNVSTINAGGRYARMVITLTNGQKFVVTAEEII